MVGRDGGRKEKNGKVTKPFSLLLSLLLLLFLLL